MNCNSPISPDIYRTVKCEPDNNNNIISLKNDLIQQKEDYEQRIVQLQKTHEEQISKLCNELEKSSTLLHEYKLELDLMRLELNLKEKQLKNQTNDLPCSNGYFQTESLELISENTKLKKDLTTLTTKNQLLTNEMQEARQYLLKMIAGLE
ncbi:hypothetical protein I4U23_026029 [Adineta vaga]|nr:hypothetical protein I4U23_026029 [Adineta vaga]